MHKRLFVVNGWVPWQLVGLLLEQLTCRRSSARWPSEVGRLLRPELFFTLRCARSCCFVPQPRSCFLARMNDHLFLLWYKRAEASIYLLAVVIPLFFSHSVCFSGFHNCRKDIFNYPCKLFCKQNINLIKSAFLRPKPHAFLPPAQLSAPGQLQQLGSLLVGMKTETLLSLSSDRLLSSLPAAARLNPGLSPPQVNALSTKLWVRHTHNYIIFMHFGRFYIWILSVVFN